MYYLPISLTWFKRYKEYSKTALSLCCQSLTGKRTFSLLAWFFSYKTSPTRVLILRDWAEWAPWRIQLHAFAPWDCWVVLTALYWASSKIHHRVDISRFQCHIPSNIPRIMGRPRARAVIPESGSVTSSRRCVTSQVNGSSIDHDVTWLPGYWHFRIRQTLPKIVCI